MVNHLDETEKRWFAIRTRARCEKWVRDVLEKKGIHSWVPLQKFARRYTRSVRLVERPLINGYVFVSIVKADYIPVLETENVAGFVKSRKDLRAIPESELDILRRITLETDLEVSAQAGVFTEGDPVQIIAGNLAGMSGRILKTEGKHKMQVELESLGYSLLITINTAFLANLKRVKN